MVAILILCDNITFQIQLIVAFYCVYSLDGYKVQYAHLYIQYHKVKLLRIHNYVKDLYLCLNLNPTKKLM